MTSSSDARFLPIGGVSPRAVIDSAATQSVTDSLPRDPETPAEHELDDHLILQLQKGDRTAMEAIYARYARLLLGIGCQILHNTADAEDLVQEVFLYLFRKSNVYDLSKGSLRSWLLVTTYSRAFNKYRRFKNEILHVRQNGEAAISNVPSVPPGERDELGEILYWRSHLHEAFLELSEEQRVTLTLHFFEGYTLSEISAKMGQSVGNVRHYCYRGLERLRKQLSRNGKRSLKNP